MKGSDHGAAPFQILLTFDTAEELDLALQYIGDGDAPVMPGDGAGVTVDGRTYPLWDDYDQAVAHLTGLMKEGS